ncbi:hypothetical protein [Sulfurihydrogenibium subterraneum]|uniref:hypothetical protein n=1 Tax=Sulfurihydrogenibium subterraneum TaxID=171121 RepID=UPI0012EC81B1|nr:hypothetical protein [Sulfurihydrogenibium subterraneum]
MSSPGASAKGFYSLSMNITSAQIISPAIDDTTNPISFPVDTISGSLSLYYNGPTNTNPLDGMIDNAEICFEEPTNKCFLVPLSGIVKPGDSLKFDISLKVHKFESPWIILNPYEDSTVILNPVKVQIGTGDGNKTIFGYTLPQNVRDTDLGYITYGDEITVYNNGSFACSLNSSLECTITKSGQNITVTFSNPPANGNNIELEYSVRKHYDWNPSVNAGNHLYNGKNYTIVNAILKVRVKFYNGDHLDVNQPIQFQVVPKVM